MTLQLGFDLAKALERENVEKTVLDKLRTSNIPKMPNSVTDQQLLLFYCACEKNFDDTTACIKNYYDHKTKAPEHFARRDPDSQKIQQCLQNQ